MEGRAPETTPKVTVPGYVPRPPAPARDRALEPERQLAPEIVELVDRSAALRQGLALLHRAPLEWVAAALGMHPLIVERARACLDRRPDREFVIRAYVRALERRRLEAPPTPGSAVPPRCGPEELVRAAERHALGVQFLLCAPLEVAAVSFTVHPDVVLRARELLARRGILPEEARGDQ
jgi:hypothetical protein